MPRLFVDRLRSQAREAARRNAELRREAEAKRSEERAALSEIRPLLGTAVEAAIEGELEVAFEGRFSPAAVTLLARLGFAAEQVKPKRRVARGKTGARRSTRAESCLLDLARRISHLPHWEGSLTGRTRRVMTYFRHTLTERSIEDLGEEFCDLGQFLGLNESIASSGVVHWAKLSKQELNDIIGDLERLLSIEESDATEVHADSVAETHHCHLSWRKSRKSEEGIKEKVPEAFFAGCFRRLTTDVGQSAMREVDSQIGSKASAGKREHLLRFKSDRNGELRLMSEDPARDVRVPLSQEQLAGLLELRGLSVQWVRPARPALHCLRVKW